MAQATVILDDRYELGPVLGNGGMARVHKGLDRQLKRPVAVKVLSSPFDRDKDFVERFRREAHAAARLNHPNIVAVYDSGSDDGTHYIVTELVEGETLADLLQREGALPPERVVEIARQVCHGLEAAHEKGVVHRDVKPGNVMITPEGRVKVVDFGIARAAGAESVTRTGLVMGSASYLSPEQARGEPGDERSDIYSLGCVLYQMLTGRPPFVAENPISALYQHVNEPVEPPSSIRPVPAALENVVLHALEKGPAKRFGSVKEMEDALEAALGSDDTKTLPLPVAAGELTAPVRRVEATAPVQRVGDTAPVQRSPGASHRRGRPFPWAIVGAVVLGLLVVAALAMALGGFDPKQAARQAARDANQRSEEPTPTDSPTSVPETLTVEDAYAGLLTTIAQAEGDGADEGVVEDLQDRAGKVLEAYQGGDAEAVQKEIQEFGKKLGEATEKDEISFESADRIEGALDDLVLAIENDPPVVVEEPEEQDSSGGEESPGDKGKGHGNGNGKGHGNGDD